MMMRRRMNMRVWTVGPSYSSSMKKRKRMTRWRIVGIILGGGRMEER